MTLFIGTEKGIYTDTVASRYGMIRPYEKKARSFSFGQNNTYNAVMTGAGELSQILSVFSIVKERLVAVNDLVFCFNKIDKVFPQKEIAETFSNEAFDFLLILKNNKDGTVAAFTTGPSGYPIRVPLPYAGGHQDAILVATGAMDAGATPEKAMEIALTRTGIAGEFKDIDFCPL